MDVVENYIIQRKKIDPAYSRGQFSQGAKVSRQLMHLHRKNPEMAWSKKSALRIEIYTGGAIPVRQLR